MELIRTLLAQQPLMALFLTIALGYLVGEINVKGFSLGVGAVLFVALAVEELKAHPEAWEPILRASRRGRVTLLYSSRDTEHNNAVALKQYLDRKLRRSVPSH